MSAERSELLKWYALSYEQRKEIAKDGPFCPITANKCLTDTWNLSNPPDCSCGRLVRELKEISELRRLADDLIAWGPKRNTYDRTEIESLRVEIDALIERARKLRQ